jgi:hypothetical protein
VTAAGDDASLPSVHLFDLSASAYFHMSRGQEDQSILLVYVFFVFIMDCYPPTSLCLKFDDVAVSFFFPLNFFLLVKRHTFISLIFGKSF